jgi:hypothetical protein
LSIGFRRYPSQPLQEEGIRGPGVPVCKRDARRIFVSRLRNILSPARERAYRRDRIEEHHGIDWGIDLVFG